MQEIIELFICYFQHIQYVPWLHCSVAEPILLRLFKLLYGSFVCVVLGYYMAALSVLF